MKLRKKYTQLYSILLYFILDNLTNTLCEYNKKSELKKFYYNAKVSFLSVFEGVKKNVRITVIKTRRIRKFWKISLRSMR